MENEDGKPMTEKEAMARIARLAKTWGRSSNASQPENGSDGPKTLSISPKPDAK